MPRRQNYVGWEQPSAGSGNAFSNRGAQSVAQSEGRQQPSNAFARTQPARSNAFGGSAAFGQRESTGSILDRVQPAPGGAQNAFGRQAPSASFGAPQHQYAATAPRNAFGGTGASVGPMMGAQLPPPPPRAPQGLGIANRLSAAPQSNAFGGEQRHQASQQRSSAFGAQAQLAHGGTASGHAFGGLGGHAAPPQPSATGQAFAHTHTPGGPQHARPNAFASAGAAATHAFAAPLSASAPPQSRNAFGGAAAPSAFQTQQSSRATPARANAFGGAASQAAVAHGAPARGGPQAQTVAFEVPEAAKRAAAPSTVDEASAAAAAQAWSAEAFTLGRIPESAPPPEVC